MGARFGRYETLQPLASGGMATVHLARALGAGGFERLVAIKAMHPGLAVEPEFIAMFLDEARVAARIRHPNVVATLDVDNGPNGLYLVMEFVEGPSLAAAIRALRKAGRPMPPGIALRIAIDTLMGLHAAHEQVGASGEPLNIVHRDVSPHNILIGLDGVVKLTDFGVAHAESRLATTRTGEAKGKVGYMSPQQVRSEPVDRLADIYAAGVVLWEALTLRRLFEADNDAALVSAVVEGAKRAPRDVDPSIPEPVDRECMRALRVESSFRHPTALAFAEALELAAEEARLTVASPRALAAFVKELGAHKPINVPPPPAAPAEGASAEGSDGGRPSAPGAPKSQRSDSFPLAAIAGPPSEGNSQKSVLSSVHALSQPPTIPRARARGIVALAAALGAGAVLAAHFLAGSPASGSAGAPSAVSAEANARAAAGDAPAPGGAATSITVTVAPSPSTAPSSSPTAVSSAGRASSSAAAPSPHHVPTPVTGPASPAPPQKGKPKPGPADDWRPQGL